MLSNEDRRSALARLVDTKLITRVQPPMLVPAHPFFELAGEEFGRHLFLTTGVDGEEYCLRPDFTLPIADAYLRGGLAGTPASYGYLGTVFRQSPEGPTEFDQAGLELLSQPNPDEALDQVITFARWALNVYGVTAPLIRLGGVSLFEALLNSLDMPQAWRARIRSKLGNPDGLDRVLTRFTNPPDEHASHYPKDPVELADFVNEIMFRGGLNPMSGRSPEEIAGRYLDKATLASDRATPETAQLLRDYLSINERALEALTTIEQLTKAHDIDLSAELTALRTHVRGIQALAPKSVLMFDAAFAPQLDYYTGIVFEMYGERGVVLASGGQYDRLLERLGSETAITASGCAVWVERLEEEIELEQQ